MLLICETIHGESLNKFNIKYSSFDYNNGLLTFKSTNGAIRLNDLVYVPDSDIGGIISQIKSDSKNKEREFICRSLYDIINNYYMIDNISGSTTIGDALNIIFENFIDDLAIEVVENEYSKLEVGTILINGNIFKDGDVKSLFTIIKERLIEKNLAITFVYKFNKILCIIRRSNLYKKYNLRVIENELNPYKIGIIGYLMYEKEEAKEGENRFLYEDIFYYFDGKEVSEEEFENIREQYQTLLITRVITDTVTVKEYKPRLYKEARVLKYNSASLKQRAPKTSKNKEESYLQYRQREAERLRRFREKQEEPEKNAINKLKDSMKKEYNKVVKEIKKALNNNDNNYFYSNNTKNLVNNGLCRIDVNEINIAGIGVGDIVETVDSYGRITRERVINKNIKIEEGRRADDIIFEQIN